MTERTTIKGSQEVIGGKTTYIRTIMHTIQGMSPVKKGILGLYFLFATGSFTGETYNDGKRALTQFRKNKIAPTSEEEWEQVKAGCSENMWGNFWSATVFPFSWIAHVIPAAVMKLNSKRE
jgi:hypothetical protein